MMATNMQVKWNADCDSCGTVTARGDRQ